ncbi:hypothetical protein CSB11_02345 [Candidatus Campbellbacteria bacterium]|nr:MAG: hypothetical protein CSB11_02345 [Candidatus Campbellbacteria bacterium]
MNILYFSLYYIQNKNIKTHQLNYWFPSKGKKINKYESVRCSYSIFDTKSVFVSEQVILDKYKELALYFSDYSNSFFTSKVNEKYLGSSKVNNTTFPELLRMVKQDCEQFQKGKGNRNDKTINWIYYKNNPELDEIIKELKKDKDEEDVGDFTESEYFKELERQQKPLKGEELEKAAKELKEMYIITDEQLQPILEKLKEGKIPDMREYEFR